jgi:hypothetical protein
MDDDARELLKKHLAHVSGVYMWWTSKNSFTITDTINNEVKEYKIEEIK